MLQSCLSLSVRFEAASLAFNVASVTCGIERLFDKGGDAVDAGGPGECARVRVPGQSGGLWGSHLQGLD